MPDRERGITGAILHRQFQERSKWDLHNCSQQHFKKKRGVGSYQSHFDTRDPEALLLNYATPSGNCIHVTSWKPFILPIKIGPKSKSKVEFKIIQINGPCITRQREAINTDNVTVHIEATCTLFVTTNPAGVCRPDHFKVWRDRSHPRNSQENYQAHNGFLQLFS